MALTQIYSAIPDDVITAARWNNEFGNIYSNGTDVAFPVTKAVSFAGFTLTIDASGVSTISSPSNSGFLLTVGAKSGAPGPNGSLATITASTFTDSDTAVSGTASLWTGVSIRTPTLAASNAITTTTAASLYVEGPPTTGVNQTISNKYAILTGAGMIGSTPGSAIASASSIAVVSQFTTVTGTTDISSITTTLLVGTTFRLRFTGAGLNLASNGSTLFGPHGVAYRTVPGEVIEFLSVASGVYTYYTINGPKERTGVTIEANFSATPDGFLPEDGAAVSRTTYLGLFTEIGTTFGVGDGTTTFNVPLTLGLVAINRDPANSVITSASTNGGNADVLGGKGGAQTHTLTTGQIPAHTHSVPLHNPVAGANAECGLAQGGLLGTTTTSSVGSGAAHSNTQPWIAKEKYIRF